MQHTKRGGMCISVRDERQSREDHVRSWSSAAYCWSAREYTAFRWNEHNRGNADSFPAQQVKMLMMQPTSVIDFTFWLLYHIYLWTGRRLKDICLPTLHFVWNYCELYLIFHRNESHTYKIENIFKLLSHYMFWKISLQYGNCYRKTTWV